MGLIPDDVIAEIRTRADIVAVIGQHVQLRKAGPARAEAGALVPSARDWVRTYCWP